MLIAVLELLYWFALPMLVRQQLVRAMREAGIGDASADVSRVSPYELQVLGLRAGDDDELRVGSIDVGYDMRSLWDGRVNTIEVAGAEYRIAIRDEGIDLGPLADLRGGGPAGDGKLPFDRLRLRASALVLDWHGRQFRLPVRGTLTQEGAGVLAIDLTADALGVPVDIRGRITQQGSARRIEMNIAVLDAEIPLTGNLEADGTGTLATAVGPASFQRRVAGQSLHAQGLTVKFEGDIGKQRVTADMSAESLAWGPHSLRDVKLHAVQSPREGAKFGRGVAFTVTSGPIRSESEGRLITLPGGTFAGDGWLTDSWKPAVNASLSFREGEFAHEAAKLRLSGIEATIPVTWNLEKPAKPGAFRVPTAQLGDDFLLPLTGAAALADGRVELSADWPLIEGAVVRAEGWVDPLASRGVITAKLPRFEVTDPFALAGRFSQLQGAKVTGAFTFEGRFEFTPTGPRPRLTLGVENAAVRNEDGSAGIEGASGGVTLISLAPLRSPANQKFTVKRAYSGRLALLDGGVSLRVESGDSLLVERTHWRWSDGGEFRVHAFRLDPRGESFDFEVFTEDLSIREWLRLISSQKMEGEGRLYGRLPVTLTWGKERKELTFGRGYLYSVPMEEGWFRIHDRTLLAEAVRDLPLDPGVIAEEARARIIAGLHDFHYTALKFDFIPEPDGGLLGVMTTKGRSRDPERPVNFQGVTVNFTGLDELLNAAILYGSAGQ